jgi:hypothetical protein
MTLLTSSGESRWDYQLAAGISKDVEADDSIFATAKARLPWLFLALLEIIFAAYFGKAPEENHELFSPPNSQQWRNGGDNRRQHSNTASHFDRIPFSRCEAAHAVQNAPLSSHVLRSNAGAHVRCID